MQEFTIKRMGHLGDGITETGLFAPRTLPGELVQANQQGQTLMDRRILTPSSDRVSPPCPHFKTVFLPPMRGAPAEWVLEFF